MNVNFYNVAAKDGKTAAERFALLTKDGKSFYTVGDDLYFGEQKINNASDLSDAINNIARNSSSILSITGTLEKLENTESTSGSIRNIIKGYLDDLDVSEFALTSVASSVLTISGIKEVDGKIVKGDSSVTLAKVAMTGEAADIDYDGSTSGLEATTVQAAIDELADESADGVDSKTVYVVTENGTSSDNFSKKYSIYQGSDGDASDPVAAEKLVDINIPKDMVVEDGSVVNITYNSETGKLMDGSTDVTAIIKGESGTASASDAGKYIKLVIANSDSGVLYIKVTDLVDIYTAEQSASSVQLTIDANNEISAVIVDGAVTTDKIADGNVTKAKLSSTLQDSIDLADSALQAADITEGATNGTIAIDGTDVAVHGLTNVAFSGEADDVAYSSVMSVAGALDDIYDAIGAGGSVATQIQEAIEELDTESDVAVASISGSIVTITGSVKEVDGVIAKGSASDIVLEEVAVTGAAADVSVADAGSNFESATTVEAALAELAQKLTWREV